MKTNRPLFVSLDGPKGVGKTTLLEAVTQSLRAADKKVIRLCERKSDPHRGETMALVNELVRHPGRRPPAAGWSWRCAYALPTAVPG